MLKHAIVGKLVKIEGEGCRCTDAKGECGNFRYSVMIETDNGDFCVEDLPSEARCIIWVEKGKENNETH